MAEHIEQHTFKSYEQLCLHCASLFKRCSLVIDLNLKEAVKHGFEQRFFVCLFVFSRCQELEICIFQSRNSFSGSEVARVRVHVLTF